MSSHLATDARKVLATALVAAAAGLTKLADLVRPPAAAPKPAGGGGSGPIKPQ